MRIALTAALMMAAAVAWADEPRPAEAEAEAEAAAATPAAEKAAEPAAASEETPAAAAAIEDEKPFKVPAGYRPKTIGGKQMFCKNVVVLGSRFGKESCRSEAQLREIDRQKEAPANLDNPTCSGGACASK
jgi:hypothetical protein